MPPSASARSCWKRRIALCAIAVLCMYDTASASVPAEYLSPYLPPCTRHYNRYAQYFPDQQFDKWWANYNDIVRNATDEYMDLLEQGSTELPSTAKELAAKLFEKMSEDEIDALDRSAFGSIMLEFLRVYECALWEYEYNMGVEILIDSVIGLIGVPITTTNLDIGNYLYTDVLRRYHLTREILVARRALARTLGITAGISKLDPLDRELVRLQRASLDLRNGFALSADAAMCLPARTWSTRDVLRDLPPSSLHGT